jgi:hypothetical protein
MLRHLPYGARPNTYRVIFDDRSHLVTVLHIRHDARKPMKARETQS